MMRRSSITPGIGANRISRMPITAPTKTRSLFPRSSRRASGRSLGRTRPKPQIERGDLAIGAFRHRRVERAGAIEEAGERLVLDRDDSVAEGEPLDPPGERVGAASDHRRRRHRRPVVAQRHRIMVWIGDDEVGALDVPQALAGGDEIGVELLALLLEAGLAPPGANPAAKLAPAHPPVLGEFPAGDQLVGGRGEKKGPRETSGPPEAPPPQ